jgi:hypothetical protein
VDDGRELAEFADEEAVAVRELWDADGLRVNFDDYIGIRRKFREKKDTATLLVPFLIGCTDYDRCHS